MEHHEDFEEGLGKLSEGGALQLAMWTRMIKRLSFSHHYFPPNMDDVKGGKYAKYSNHKYAYMQNLRTKVDDVEGKGEKYAKYLNNKYENMQNIRTTNMQICKTSDPKWEM